MEVRKTGLYNRMGEVFYAIAIDVITAEAG